MTVDAFLASRVTDENVKFVHRLRRLPYQIACAAGLVAQIIPPIQYTQFPQIHCGHRIRRQRRHSLRLGVWRTASDSLSASVITVLPSPVKPVGTLPRHTFVPSSRVSHAV
jgi:hypothetical protein